MISVKSCKCCKTCIENALTHARVRRQSQQQHRVCGYGQSVTSVQQVVIWPAKPKRRSLQRLSWSSMLDRQNLRHLSDLRWVRLDSTSCLSARTSMPRLLTKRFAPHRFHCWHFFLVPMRVNHQCVVFWSTAGRHPGASRDHSLQRQKLHICRSSAACCAECQLLYVCLFRVQGLIIVFETTFY